MNEFCKVQQIPITDWRQHTGASGWPHKPRDSQVAQVARVTRATRATHVAYLSREASCTKAIHVIRSRSSYQQHSGLNQNRKHPFKAYTMESTHWDFETLTDTVSYFRQPSKKTPLNGPSLVVLCTWMSANRKHIAKYTQQYRQRYPDAELLVVESGVADMVYRSKGTQRQRLLLARDALISHITYPTPGHPPPRIVLHVFSNGGAQCAVQLATLLPPNLRPHAFSAVVFDSCPGTATYQRTVHAMSLSMPKSPVAKIIGPPVIHLVLCFLFLALWVTGAEDVITRIRRQLNDHELISHDVPRLYLYSQADQLVPWQDVKSHADDARSKGYTKTNELMFESSAHCAHAMSHKDQYWQSIGALLEGKD